MGKLILNSFHFLCLTCTIAISAYCAYKFYLNEDNSVVEFNKFNGNENNIYPSLSLCFYGDGMFNQKWISQNHISEEISNATFSKTKYYEKFLLGEIWIKEFLNITYDNVTPDLKRILRRIKMFSADETGDVNIYKWGGSNNFKKETPFYESFKSPTDKCFSMDIDAKNIESLNEHHLSKIKFSIFNFLNGVFVENNRAWLHLDIYLTYPNQLMRSYPVIKIEKLQNKNYSSTVKVMLHATEVIARRNKYNAICEENWTEDDNQIIRKLVVKAGCRHEFWKLDTNAKRCQSQKEFIGIKIPRLMTTESSFLNDYPKPCREIQNIITTPEETILDASQTNNWNVPVPFINFEFHFKTSTFKVIRSVRAFDGESLIGNLGGYLGLFLGFAIWQAPDLIIKVRIQVKSVLKTFFTTN